MLGGNNRLSIQIWYGSRRQGRSFPFYLQLVYKEGILLIKIIH